MSIRPELLDELLKDFKRPEDITGTNGLLQQLTKAVIEGCLDTETEVHLEQPQYQTEGKAKKDRRQGYPQKPLKGN